MPCKSQHASHILALLWSFRCIMDWFQKMFSLAEIPLFPLCSPTFTGPCRPSSFNIPLKPLWWVPPVGCTLLCALTAPGARQYCSTFLSALQLPIDWIPSGLAPEGWELYHLHSQGDTSFWHSVRNLYFLSPLLPGPQYSQTKLSWILKREYLSYAFSSSLINNTETHIFVLNGPSKNSNYLSLCVWHSPLHKVKSLCMEKWLIPSFFKVNYNPAPL